MAYNAALICAQQSGRVPLQYANTLVVVGAHTNTSIATACR